MKRTMREIMEQAIGEMREASAQEVDEGEAGYWDQDARGCRQNSLVQITRARIWQIARKEADFWA